MSRPTQLKTNDSQLRTSRVGDAFPNKRNK